MVRSLVQVPPSTTPSQRRRHSGASSTACCGLTRPRTWICHLLHSIYRWADAGQEAFFQSAGEPGRVLRDLYLKRAVMRSVTVHVVRGGCSSTLADTVRVRSWISKVGTTSWQSATEILSAARGS